ncbi:MAG TPA: SpoIVB peptidase [Tenericutes bacterium]|nr:SpoIVB peptidase [Mycoplasmatota bacterium]
MFFKKIKKTLIIMLLSIIIPTTALAYSDYIIAGGESVGIQLNTKGVLVAGIYEINSTYPAIDAGIKVGDMIVSIDNNKVETIEQLASYINNRSDSTIKIGYIRNSILSHTNLKLYKDNNNVYKTGLYVKDTVTGVGTLTFIDPNTKIFGALGHEIVDRNTGKVLEIKEGKIYNSSITGIEPSTDGAPGEKNARFYTDEVNGKVNKNTQQGIFGNYTNQIPNKKLYKVAKYADIKKGSAKIMTVLNDTDVETYDINIISLNNTGKTKNILFEITDQKLLSITNGIVQGMSGSPIIQNDYIIGAVTHVVIDNPAKGYGIIITNMLEEAES